MVADASQALVLADAAQEQALVLVDESGMPGRFYFEAEKKPQVSVLYGFIFPTVVASSQQCQVIQSEKENGLEEGRRKRVEGWT